MATQKTYYCYLIINDQTHTYIGSTNDLTKRLEKHNSKIKGGAKSTKKSQTWKFHTIVGMFTKQEAYSFEWYWKHTLTKKNTWRRTGSTLDLKLKRLNILLKEKMDKQIKIMNY
jgi:predicted GIY-YIG superfamily endonuclease